MHISVTHPEHAYTDGDLVVAFREGNIVAAADTFWNGYYPFIDLEASGTVDGMIRAAKANLPLANEKAKVVPGHGGERRTAATDSRKLSGGVLEDRPGTGRAQFLYLRNRHSVPHTRERSQVVDYENRRFRPCRDLPDKVAIRCGGTEDVRASMEVNNR